MNPEIINSILGVVTFLAHIGAITLLVVMFRAPQGTIAQFIREHVMWLVFGTSFIAMIMSLFYSEILHYAPCTLCWYQRILVYPIAIITGLALFRKDRSVLPYVTALAGVGTLIAAYHHFLQFNLVPEVPCGAQSVSCSLRFVLEMGYITFPLMSFTAFLLILLFIQTSKRALPTNGAQS